MAVIGKRVYSPRPQVFDPGAPPRRAQITGRTPAPEYPARTVR